VAARTLAGVLELAFALKRERPERTAAQVHQIMLAAGERPPTVRTLQTHLGAARLEGSRMPGVAQDSPSAEFGGAAFQQSIAPWSPVEGRCGQECTEVGAFLWTD
jgi:hypothetical protein